MHNTITVKEIVDTVFQDYYKSSMFIATAKCDFKCGGEVCQNSKLNLMPNVTVKISDVFKRYMGSNITKAIVIGGLEPFLKFEEVYNLIKYFREHGCDDNFVIYTGYYPEEIGMGVILDRLKEFKNIIIKFGRYIPNINGIYDQILGITLCSYNQFAEKIS